jgi:hypothetical protein
MEPPPHTGLVTGPTHTGVVPPMPPPPDTGVTVTAAPVGTSPVPSVRPR